MRTVSNTLPISNVAVAGRLDLLRRRFGRVVIPRAVARELAGFVWAMARQVSPAT